MNLLSGTHLFWDSNINIIDAEKNKEAIIERVLERGSVENIKEIISYYGRDQLPKLPPTQGGLVIKPCIL